MITLRFVLMLLAVVVLFLAAATVGAHPRVNLFALGMALWALSTMVTV